MKNAQTWDSGHLSETQKRHSFYENLRKYFMTVREPANGPQTTDIGSNLPPLTLLPGLKTN